MQERKTQSQIPACQMTNTFTIRQSKWNLLVAVKQEKIPKRRSAQEISHFLQVHWACVQVFRLWSKECEIFNLFLSPTIALYAFIHKKLVN